MEFVPLILLVTLLQICLCTFITLNVRRDIRSLVKICSRQSEEITELKDALKKAIIIPDPTANASDS